MKDEIVLVTGSARGLGRGICLEFARLGATVVCWDINEHGNMETVALAAKASPREKAIYGYLCDISNREEVMATAQRVMKEVGNVSILVNNAGIISAGRLETYRPEDIVRTVNTNFVSHFWTIEAFLPHMKSINSGQIVCMSSMAGLMPTEFMVPYCSTKYAITGLMDSLSEELVRTHHDNIQLTTIHPFFANSNSTMDEFDKAGPEMMKAHKVVQTIVDGILKKKRDFSIPGILMFPTKVLKLYPRDVIRAFRSLTLGKWSQYFMESTEPIIVR